MNLIFDVGGTFIKWGLFKNNIKIKQGKFATNAQQNKTNEIAQSMINFYQEINQESGYEITKVGISTTGVVDSKNLSIAFADQYMIPNYTGLNYGLEFKKAGIDNLLVVENDVNSALAGEISNLTSKEDTIFMITLGTGIGGAIYIYQNFYTGVNGYAGEVGKMIINNEVWECSASAINFERHAQAVFQDGQLTCEQIFHDASSLLKYKTVIDEWYDNLATGIGNILMNWNPAIFIVGGGVCANPNFDLKIIETKIIDKFGTMILQNTKLVKPHYYNDAALYGINYLLNQK